MIVFNPPVILFNVSLILFKPTEDLVQPPPTRGMENPGQGYGLLILRASPRAPRTRRELRVQPPGDLVQAIPDLVQAGEDLVQPAYMILFNRRPPGAWEIPARVTDC